MDTPASRVSPISVCHVLAVLSIRQTPAVFFALEKRLYLREQDTSQGFHLVVRYSRAVVVDFSLSSPIGAASSLKVAHRQTDSPGTLCHPQ